jgi:flagellar hook-associated protein 2
MVTPSITSLGIGTGIDANSIVEKLMALERAPLNILAQREISYNAKISAFGSLKTRFDAIKSAADKMADPATLAAFTATVGDSDVVTASAGSLAGPGSYNVNVLQLAQAQKSFTGLYGSSDTFAAGTLTFTINGTDHVITFDGGSLADVRSAINAADIGVTATTVTGDAGARLVLTSSETGTDNAFSLAVTGGDANLASLATFDGAHPNALAAQNASIEVEGETVTSQSNTVTGAIPDVTLTLGSVGSTTVDIARSSASAVDTVKDFVTAFNAAVTELRTVSAYNATTKTGAALNGDATVRTLQGLLRNAGNTTPASISGSTYETLSSLGIRFQSDGTLALDETMLNSAIDSDFTAVTNTLNAFGTVFSDLGDQATRYDGLLTNRTDGLSATISRMADQRIQMEARLEQTEKRLRAQFTALDTLVGRLNSTSSFLTQQLASLSALSNG